MAENFQAVFERLKAILQAYESRLLVKTDKAGIYYLNAPFSEKFKKELFFGAVQIKKNYVSYHLMPVYIFPDLLEGVSPALRKRMQGKACFNFTVVKEELLAELAELTCQAVERFKQVG